MLPVYAYQKKPGGGAPPVFDPATLALTGWWRASYAASPWVGTASAGDSGNNDASQGGGFAPTVGAALNGLDGADFNGSDQRLVCDGTDGTYWSSTDGYIVLLYHADAAPAAADPSTPYNDPNLVILDGGGHVGLSVNADGVRGYRHDGAYKTASSAIGNATGVPHLAWMKWTGGNLYVATDGGSWSAGTALGTATLPGIAVKLGGHFAYFNGRIYEVMFGPPSIDSSRSDLISYFNARYAQSF